MRAEVLTLDNPFHPQSRRVEVVRRRRSVRSLAPRTDAPHLAVLNGKPILRAGWRRKLQDGDRLAFVVLPRGGRNGGGGSNPLAAVASLALMAFAGPLAGALLPGGLGGAIGSQVLFGTFTTGMLTQLGVVMAGQALINALLPQPGQPALQQASPTYSLQAQGNIARIGAPIPVQYGRMKFYPDFAAQPYREYAGNEEYLFQLFCVGQGQHDIEAIQIEDTPISAFPEITTEVVEPGGALTLFPASVTTSVEVSGQELTGRKVVTWARSGTLLTVTETAHERVVGQAINITITTGTGPANGVYQIASVPTADTYILTVATGTGSGDATVDSIIGGMSGFTASAADTQATTIAIDLIFTRGLFATSGGNLSDKTVTWVVQARQVDAGGAPIGSWITLGSESLTDRTQTPIRRSYRYTLATVGRYAVRVYRTSERDAAGDVGNDILWSGLRSYLKEVTDFGDVTLIAMRSRATNSLSSLASRKVAVIATRKLPIWNGTSWSAPTATRSIAWAIADAVRNTSYGAGWADTRIDLASLLSLDAVWLARGDEFNGRFDSIASWWDAAQMIGRAGRMRPFLQGGIMRFVRDGAATVPVALFPASKMRAGSFGIDYVMPSDDTADAIDVTYFDGEVWAERTVRAALSGSTAAKPVKLDLTRGVTIRAQALREGLFEAAANRYRRRFVRFETEMDGFIPAVGDLIAIQHDTPAWGQEAEALDWQPGSRMLTVSEDLTFGAGTHYVALRRPNGGLSGPYAVTAGAMPDQVILASDPDMTPYTGSEMDRTHVLFGKANQWSALAKLISAKPISRHHVAIEAVLDDPSVHTADTGVVAPALVVSQLPRRATVPVVSGLLARRVAGDSTRVLLAWRPAAGADIYQIEAAEGSDISDPTVSWTRVGDTTAAQYHLALIYSNRTMLRVRGVGIAEGTWTYGALGNLIPDFWNSLGATPFWTGDANPMWSY